MKTRIPFVTLCGLLSLLNGCQTYEEGLPLPTSARAQQSPEPPGPITAPDVKPGPISAYPGPKISDRGESPVPDFSAIGRTNQSRQRTLPPQTVCELIQRLKDLEREEKTVRLLLKEKLEEQKQELARQQKDLEALNAAGGTPSANAAAKTSNEEKLSQILSRLDQMEKRMQQMEKPPLTDADRKDPGPAPGGLAPAGTAPR